MRNVSRACALASIIAVCAASPASAGVPHVIQPGETLWTIAAANNFTTRALAAANGLSEDSQVILGSTIQIPSEYEAAQALAQQGGQTPVTQQVPAQQTKGGQTPVTQPGGYLVRPGDTLTGIAAAHGVSAGALAAANDLSPDAFVIEGTTLTIPSVSSAVVSGPLPLGGYTVRVGDTLSGLAETAGVSPEQI